MKRLCVMLFTIPCLLLTGCGSGAEEKRFEEFSAAMCERESVSFTANVRAEYDDHTARFTLAYAGEGDSCSVTVMEPEIISGVTMRFEGGKSVLDCESICVDTGFLDENGLTPVNALPIIVRAMRSGHLDSCAKEDGVPVWYVVPEDGLTVALRVAGDMTPLGAELASEGRVRVFCEITDWK